MRGGFYMCKIYRILSIALVAIMLITTDFTAYAASEDDYVTINQNEYSSEVIVYEDGISINGVYYTCEEFEKLLEEAQEKPKASGNNGGNGPRRSAAALVAGTWFIPGVGEVVITAAGVVIVAGVTIAAGTWVYNTVQDWFAQQAEIKEAKANIPSRLKDDKGNVKVGDFNQKVPGKNAKKEKKGWTIERDTAGHGGRYWKLKDKAGNRVASLDQNGKVLGK